MTFRTGDWGSVHIGDQAGNIMGLQTEIMPQPMRIEDGAQTGRDGILGGWPDDIEVFQYPGNIQVGAQMQVTVIQTCNNRSA